jgi:hypothetical protein
VDILASWSIVPNIMMSNGIIGIFGVGIDRPARRTNQRVLGIDV